MRYVLRPDNTERPPPFTADGEDTGEETVEDTGEETGDREYIYGICAMVLICGVVLNVFAYGVISVLNCQVKSTGLAGLGTESNDPFHLCSIDCIKLGEADDK